MDDLCITFLSLNASAFEAILMSTLIKEINLHIIPIFLLNESTDSLFLRPAPFSYFKSIINNQARSFLNSPKKGTHNSFIKPSFPGLFPFCIDLRASQNSCNVSLPLHRLRSSWVNIGVFSFFKILKTFTFCFNRSSPV